MSIMMDIENTVMWLEYIKAFSPTCADLSVVIIEFVLYMTGMFVVTAVYMGALIRVLYQLNDKYSELGRKLHHLSNPFDDPWNLP